MLGRWKDWARTIKRDGHALYLAARDPRVPWYAKGLALAVAAYAFSPIDLIPDFIPVIGYLDDLILVPLGIYLTLRLIPPHVLADARIKADAWLAERRTKPKNYWMAAIIVAVWVLAGLLIVTAVLAAPNEIKVFTNELADYRESTLETHANKASRGPLQVMPEYSYGIWRNWELSS